MKPFNMMVTKASIAVAMSVTAFSLACLSQCAPRFEHSRQTSSDTFYGDIKFGMTKAEVKQLMQQPFHLEKELPDQLTYRDSARNLVVDFQFEEERLVMTDSFEE